MNPFTKTAVGLFLVIGPQARQLLEAERICSALIQKLYEDPARTLDPGAWQNAVQMIPDQIETATISRALGRTMAVANLPSVLASICAKAAERNKANDNLAKAISSYLSKYDNPTEFNCLVLDQSDPAEINLSLTCLAVLNIGSADSYVNSTLFSASLNLSNKKTRSAIAKVFGSFGSPINSPYYLRILSSQISTQRQHSAAKKG